MQYLEQQGAGDGVFLATRGQHTLRHVGATARLGTRIPHAPPQHGKWQNEDGEGGAPVTKVGKHGQLACRNLLQQTGKTAYLRALQREPGHGESAGHGDAELERIGDQYAPQA